MLPADKGEKCGKIDNEIRSLREDLRGMKKRGVLLEDVGKRNRVYTEAAVKVLNRIGVLESRRREMYCKK